MLKNDTDVAPCHTQRMVTQRRQFPAANLHRSGGGPVQQVDDPHQRTFTRTAAANDAVHLAGLDMKVNAPQGLDRACSPLVGLKNILEINHENPMACRFL